MTTKELAKQETRKGLAWDPFSGFRGLAGLTGLFDDLYGAVPAFRMPALARELTPKVNIQETEKEYVITAALPGIKKDEVTIKVEDGVLMIGGEHKEEKEEKGKAYLRQEMTFGSFQRSFILPAGVHPEDVKGVHKDGVLTVTLPKPAPEKSRGVTVKVE